MDLLISAQYAHDGTDAMGQTMDIDFMIQQLSKAMEKKAEYDWYIQGIDSKYDDIKQLWMKDRIVSAVQ